MRDEKYSCPNPDCDYIGFEECECPECGSKLVRPNGEEYEDLAEDNYGNGNINNMSDDLSYDDDPEAISWYDDSNLVA